MLTILIPGKPKPKPAGTLKFSHGRPFLSMDKNGYGVYCKKTISTISLQSDNTVYPYGIVYHFEVPNLLRLGDITNCAEAIQDCLVKAKVIDNDTPKIVNKVFTSLKISNKYLTSVYLCDNLEELKDTILMVL